MDLIIKKLKDLGFSEYEAKAYLSLLKQNPVNGYELSKNSGIPRSMIYQTLQKLQTKGAVIELLSNPVKYVPVAYERLLQKVQDRFEDTLRDVASQLASCSGDQDVNYFWNIQGYSNIIHKSKEILSQSHQNVYVSGRSIEINALVEEITGLSERNVVVQILSSEKLAFTLPQIQYSNVKQQDTINSSLIIVSDHQRLLVGENMGGQEGVALYTEHSCLIPLCIRCLKQEIFLSQKKWNHMNLNG